MKMVYKGFIYFFIYSKSSKQTRNWYGEIEKWTNKIYEKLQKESGTTTRKTGTSHSDEWNNRNESEG